MRWIDDGDNGRTLVPYNEARYQLGGIGRTTLYELIEQGELERVNIGWSAVSASATSRQPVGSHGCGQAVGGNRRPGLGPGAGQAGAAGAGPRQDPASLASENGGRPESSQDTPPIPEGWGILGKCSCFIVTNVAGVPTTSESLMHTY
jgi:hypothetical protein